MPNIDLSKIKGLICDMDGVLWKDNQPIGDLKEIFQTITKAGLKIVLATNNAMNSIPHFLNTLHSFGVNLEPWQVISSAVVASQFLHEKYPEGGNIYTIGEDGLREILAEKGFLHSSQGDVLAVVVAMDRQVNYEMLKTATLLIRSGIPFIGTNADPSFPTPEGLIPGAGAIIAAIQTATAVTPMILGKPEPTIYKVCLERMGLSPDETIAVGDRLSTDIACAQRVGIPSALVLSGVTSKEQAQKWEPAIDWIGSDLQELVRMLVDHA